MTPQEKAKELIEKYQKLDIEIGGQYDGYLTMKMHDAKQCALIAVDEMIMQNGELFLLPLQAEIIEHYKKTNSYLFEVKEEINKL
jgi:hypothetical protein